MSSKSTGWDTKINFSAVKNHRLKHTLLLFLLVLALSLPVQGEELSGTWKGEEENGNGYTFVFDGADWSMSGTATADWQEGSYTYNDNTVPKLLDLFIANASDSRFIGKTALFIYKIEGNTLTLTGGEPGSGYRPLTFSEGGTTRTFIVVDENRPPHDDADGGANDSDDHDKVEVYVNCFISVSATSY